eukprot:6410017-Alexandrium_andersonii.AAC.1
MLGKSQKLDPGMHGMLCQGVHMQFNTATKGFKHANPVLFLKNVPEADKSESEEEKGVRKKPTGRNPCEI